MTRSHIFVFVVTAFSGSGRDYLDVVSENTPSWHGLCLSCMVIASTAILLLCRLLLLRSGYLIFFISYLKLETGDLRDLKYGVYRIIGSGATVQSVSRCPLVVKTAVPSFHDGMKKLHRWNHLNSECNFLYLLRRRKRETCVVHRLLSTFDPEGDTFRYV